ncbi:MAG: ECF-type sigma factor [Bacillota bacterium]|nr:ECF-type sigma factor [Bacillota bacterium]
MTASEKAKFKRLLEIRNAADREANRAKGATEKFERERMNLGIVNPTGFEEKLLEHYRVRRDVNMQIMLSLEQILDMLPDPYLSLLLKYRYIDNLTFEEIAEKMYCSDRTIRRHFKEWEEQLYSVE